MYLYVMIAQQHIYIDFFYVFVIRLSKFNFNKLILTI